MQIENGGGIGSIVVQDDGKILLSGQFVSANGIPVSSNLIRLNPDFSTDTGFNPQVSSSARIQMSLQNDQKIILSVNRANLEIDGNQRSKGARLNNDGSLDDTFALESNFDIGFTEFITSLKDGKALVSGNIRPNSNDIEFFRRGSIVVNSDGSTDRDFWLTNTFISRIILEDFDSVWVNGSGSEVRLQRHNAEGVLVPGFEITPSFINRRGNPIINSIEGIPGSGLLVTGAFQAINNTPAFRIAILRVERPQCFPIKTLSGATVQVCL